MKKLGIIFKREYLSRVKNKSFIIMTLLTPLIFVGFYAAVVAIAVFSGDSDGYNTIFYKDDNAILSSKVNGDTLDNFIFIQTDKVMSNDEIALNESAAFMHITDKNYEKIDSLEFISKQSPSISKIQQLKRYLEDDIFSKNLLTYNISNEQLEKLRPQININTMEASQGGELKNSSSGIKSGIGMAMAFIIYIFIFIYGSMVMRSTVEEKTNRIVEVIISSVKPFQLMLGKILGVAAVGLTQFVLWIVLATGLITAITFFVGLSSSDIAAASAAMPQSGAAPEVWNAFQGEMANMLSSFMALPFAKIIVVFLSFFVGGYLLYSSMFAAIGSAVSQESDTQQFMFPVSMPLIFGFIIAQSAVFNDPHGMVAKIFSFIPFTSPIVMAVRAPFQVSWLEIFISLAILIVTFIFMVWLSARIYRVGILMYGKKPKWRDFAKWIVRKN